MTAQRGSGGIALLFISPAQDKCGLPTPRPGRLSLGNDPVPAAREAGWALGAVWTGAENLAPPPFDPRAIQTVASRYTAYTIPVDILIFLDLPLHSAVAV